MSSHNRRRHGNAGKKSSRSGGDSSYNNKGGDGKHVGSRHSARATLARSNNTIGINDISLTTISSKAISPPPISLHSPSSGTTTTSKSGTYRTPEFEKKNVRTTTSTEFVTVDATPSSSVNAVQEWLQQNMDGRKLRDRFEEKEETRGKRHSPEFYITVIDKDSGEIFPGVWCSQKKAARKAVYAHVYDSLCVGSTSHPDISEKNDVSYPSESPIISENSMLTCNGTPTQEFMKNPINAVQKWLQTQGEKLLKNRFEESDEWKGPMHMAQFRVTVKDRKTNLSYMGEWCRQKKAAKKTAFMAVYRNLCYAPSRETIKDEGLCQTVHDGGSGTPIPTTSQVNATTTQQSVEAWKLPSLPKSHYGSTHRQHSNKQLSPLHEIRTPPEDPSYKFQIHGRDGENRETSDDLFFGFQRPVVPPRPESTHRSQIRPKAGPQSSPRQYRMFPEGDSYMDFNNYLGQPSRPHSWHIQRSIDSPKLRESESSAVDSVFSPAVEADSNEWRGELAFEEEEGAFDFHFGFEFARPNSWHGRLADKEGSVIGEERKYSHTSLSLSERN
eukprot:UC4_evm2s670